MSISDIVDVNINAWQWEKSSKLKFSILCWRNLTIQLLKKTTVQFLVIKNLYNTATHCLPDCVPSGVRVSPVYQEGLGVSGQNSLVPGGAGCIWTEQFRARRGWVYLDRTVQCQCQEGLGVSGQNSLMPGGAGCIWTEQFSASVIASSSTSKVERKMQATPIFP